jgi:hypothetical protein
MVTKPAMKKSRSQQKDLQQFTVFTEYNRPHPYMYLSHLHTWGNHSRQKLTTVNAETCQVVAKLMTTGCMFKSPLDKFL